MGNAGERVQFSRDCEVVRIPAGTPVVVPSGTEGIITQFLGGTYTLQLPASGELIRLPGTEADAIGKDPERAGGAGELPEDASLEDQVWAQLRTCFDPEIPVNIVDLGLIYDLQVTPFDGGDRNRVDVKMTLTAQGCGMGGTIAADARDKILRIPGVADADVAIVWDPPWNPRMISPEGRAKLGLE